MYSQIKGRKIKPLYIKYPVRDQSSIGINTGDIFIAPFGAALGNSE